MFISFQGTIIKAIKALLTEITALMIIARTMNWMFLISQSAAINH